MARKPPAAKSVESLKHGADKRKNIPTAEFQSVLEKEKQAPKAVRYPRNTDLDPQLVWRGKDEQDWSDLVVQAPPLYIQEKVHPKVLIDDLLAQTKAARKDEQPQLDLFADFNGMPKDVDKTEFYQHDQNWSNRMILGDSLQVMASLAEREGLRGKVQCIYIDPPYGIRFRSNFQWSTSNAKVSESDNPNEISREPEQVKAFRDTWSDGLHSYLAYLRDRLTVARDLLSETGSIFVQIGSENVHRVRALMDEVFGDGNFIVALSIQKTGSQSGEFIQANTDSILWWSKSKEDAVRKFRPLFLEREGAFSSCSNLEHEEFSANPLTSDGFRETTTCPFSFHGRTFHPGKTAHWKVTVGDLGRIGRAGRIIAQDTQIRLKYFFDDFPVMRLGSSWSDVGGATNKVYVVQTSPKVVERCILMTTDPGDLVLDPTCGSGTTAYVAEQRGRRWITIDTSRVALALARARIMGARYAFYLLSDSRAGQLKEAEITGTTPSSQPVHGNIRHGFVYERVPHITLKSIANNAEIDVIWDKWQATLEPLREKINATLKAAWQEWEIPREADKEWSAAAKKMHSDWWQARIARQKEIDASIAAKADFEYLYDKPYDDRKTVRVAGPFTVESLSPHRVLAVDENDELIDCVADARLGYSARQSFPQMILENLKIAGVQQAHKEDRITFTALAPWPGDLVCGEGRFVAGDQWLVAGGQRTSSDATSHKSQTTERRAAIFIGPEFGTVQRADLVAAAREAGDAGFDALIACAFNYEAHTTEFTKLGRIPVLKARMNADLHMAQDLKNTGKGNLFVVFGEPDIEVTCDLWLVASGGRMVASYDSAKELSGIGSLEEINRLGRTDLSGLKKFSSGGAIRPYKSAEAGFGFGTLEHSGRSGKDGNGGVSAEFKRRPRIAGGSGDAADHCRPPEDNTTGETRSAVATVGRDQQNARWAQALAAIETLKACDFPLSLTTSHYAQVTVHGVDVFKPQTGEVVSDNADGIACWFVDTDYNEESFFVRHAYFLGANDPYNALKTTLKAEIDADAWATLHSDTSRPFDKPKSGRIAVKVINHLGDEVMKVFKI